MCENFEATEIYKHHDFIRRIIVHPDGNRCITVSPLAVKMFSLHSHEHLMDFERADIHVEDASLFNNEALMACTDDSEIVFWTLSSGAISLRCKKKKPVQKSFWIVKAIAPLDMDHVVVVGVSGIHGRTGIPEFKGVALAYKVKTLSRKLFALDLTPLHTVSIRTLFHGRPCSLSFHGNRFVAANDADNTIQVWAWEHDEFQCIKVLDIGFEAPRVALSDKQILCLDYMNSDIHIFNSSTIGFIRKARCSLRICELVTVCNDKLLITYRHNNETILAMLDIDGGAILWKRTLGISVEQCELSVSKEFGAQIIAAADNNRVLQFSLPLDIEPDSLAGRMLPPLQEALSRCLAGDGSPAEYCTSLISASVCSASFPEWCSAHHLLVLAVRNGDILQSKDHSGSIAHWFENLYLAITDLELTSDEDRNVAKRYLREAERMGLIEGTEAVLAALHVANQVREEARTLHRAGILIFEQVLRIEKRLDRLKDSCEQYRKYQLYTQCVGIALQIIPIVGGASAGMISAGANIVEGLSVKDVADYAFGLGCSLTEGEISSLGDRIFGRAAEALSPESVEKMKQEELRLVEEAVSACGLSVEELRGIFMERSQENYEPCWLSDLNADKKEYSQQPECNISLQKLTLHAYGISEAEDGGSDIIVDKKPSELKSVNLERAVIQRLDQRAISTLWAAFIVRFHDTSVHAFQALRDRILSVLESNDLDGAVLVDREGISSTELARAIVDGLNNDGKGKVTLGVRVKVKQFINAII